MDERRAEFLIAVGGLCNAAALAKLLVEIATEDGRAIRGIPSTLAHAHGDDEVDSTGYATGFLVGGTPLQLADVTACTVFRPQAPASP